MEDSRVIYPILSTGEQYENFMKQDVPTGFESKKTICHPKKYLYCAERGQTGRVEEQEETSASEVGTLDHTDWP